MDVGIDEIKYIPLDYPGFSLNMSFSSNLEKWAIIPEIGFIAESSDISFSFGCGIVIKPHFN